MFPRLNEACIVVSIGKGFKFFLSETLHMESKQFNLDVKGSRHPNKQRSINSVTGFGVPSCPLRTSHTRLRSVGFYYHRGQIPGSSTLKPVHQVSSIKICGPELESPKDTQ